MTDKEMAQAYVKKNCDDSLYSFRGQELKEAFLAGLEAGRPEWHKLSEQVPTEEKQYLLKFKDGTIDVLYVGIDGNLEPFILTRECFEFYKDVVAWCEIPKYTEE